jgi:hypothetical protein
MQCIVSSRASLATLEEGQGFLGSLHSPRKPKPTLRALASGAGKRYENLNALPLTRGRFLLGESLLRRHFCRLLPVTSEQRVVAQSVLAPFPRATSLCAVRPPGLFSLV